MSKEYGTQICLTMDSRTGLVYHHTVFFIILQNNCLLFGP